MTAWTCPLPLPVGSEPNRLPTPNPVPRVLLSAWGHLYLKYLGPNLPKLMPVFERLLHFAQLGTWIPLCSSSSLIHHFSDRDFLHRVLQLQSTDLIRRTQSHEERAKEMLVDEVEGGSFSLHLPLFCGLLLPCSFHERYGASAGPSPGDSALLSIQILARAPTSAGRARWCSRNSRQLGSVFGQS